MLQVPGICKEVAEITIFKLMAFGPAGISNKLLKEFAPELAPLIQDIYNQSLREGFVPSTYILIGRYNHSLSLDATIMASKTCPTIGEHVVTIFVTQ